MARWAENRDGGRRLTNDRLATCDACGVDLAPGQGRVWRCSGLACEVEEHRLPTAKGDPMRGWHCTCLDAQACRQRLAPKPPGVRELAESAREAWRRLQAAEARTPEEEWLEASAAWWTTATAEVEL